MPARRIPGEWPLCLFLSAALGLGASGAAAQTAGTAGSGASAPASLNAERQLSDAELTARLCFVNSSALATAIEARHGVKPGTPAYAPFQAAANRATTNEANRQGCAVVLDGDGRRGAKDFTGFIVEAALAQRSEPGGPPRLLPAPGICSYSFGAVEQVSSGRDPSAAKAAIAAATRARACRIIVDQDDVYAKSAAIPNLTGAIVGALRAIPTATAAVAPAKPTSTSAVAPKPQSGPVLGREFEVTASQVTVESGFLRRYWYELHLQGKTGDRFLVEWRGSVPLQLDRDYEDTSADYPDGARIDDLASSATITLNRDGDHVVALGQSGVSFAPQRPGAMIPQFEGRTERAFIPFRLKVRKLN